MLGNLKLSMMANFEVFCKINILSKIPINVVTTDTSGTINTHSSQVGQVFMMEQNVFCIVSYILKIATKSV